MPAAPICASLTEKYAGESGELAQRKASNPKEIRTNPPALSDLTNLLRRRTKRVRTPSGIVRCYQRKGRDRGRAHSLGARFGLHRNLAPY
jgi:hypothetical protein